MWWLALKNSLNVVHTCLRCPPGWGLYMGLTTPPQKKSLVQKSQEQTFG